MSKTNYNRYFHIHTVSGIVISAALYVIFFAGAFALFMDATSEWEESSYISEINHTIDKNQPLDYDRLVVKLKQEGHDLKGRRIFIPISGKKEQEFMLSGSRDSLATAAAKKRYLLNFNTSTYEISEAKRQYSFGRLIYELHFFRQLGFIGEILAGFTAFFFLFAIVTGIIVHWKKIVSNFYTFRPLAKLKTIWTDAHTALGTIGIPFQFMYALTGAMFCLGFLSHIAEDLLEEDTGTDTIVKIKEVKQESLVYLNDSIYKVNSYVDKVQTKWEGFVPTYITISDYATEKMSFRVVGSIPTQSKLFAGGNISFKIPSGEITYEQNPYNQDYDYRLSKFTYLLHYADYGNLGVWGNIGLRLIYFIMALITCFVIISGVLIWLTARDKKNIPEKQRRYNEKVGYIYLAICLSMFPITAFSFIISKLLPESIDESREIILNSVFFGGWLLLFIFFRLKKSNYFTNRYTLLSGGILSLCIPIVNGFSSGNWIWRTFVNQHYDVFVIDILWILIGVFTLYAVYRMKQPKTPLQIKKEKQKEGKIMTMEF